MQVDNIHNPQAPLQDVMPRDIQVYGIIKQSFQRTTIYWLFVPDGISSRLVWTSSRVADPAQASQTRLNDLISTYGEFNLNSIVNPSDQYLMHHLNILVEG